MKTEREILKQKWASMISRCSNFKKSDSYIHYALKGIKVCDEWLDSFDAFYQWAMTNGFQIGLEIDRIDNNGNYEPLNCRFVTDKENTRNRSNTVYLTYQDVTKPLAEWAELYHIKYSLLYQRIKVQKWDIEDVLFTPPQKRGCINGK